MYMYYIYFFYDVYQESCAKIPNNRSVHKYMNIFHSVFIIYTDTLRFDGIVKKFYYITN